MVMGLPTGSPAADVRASTRDVERTLAALIGFEGGLALEQRPGLSVRGRPAFAEDAAANGALILQLAQAFLDSDSDIASDAAGTISVDQLDEGAALLAGGCKFALELRQGFINPRHTRFQVDGEDG